MIYRHEVIANNMTRHFLMMLRICKDLTREMQFESSRHGLELTICLNVAYK